MSYHLHGPAEGCLLPKELRKRHTCLQSTKFICGPVHCRTVSLPINPDGLGTALLSRQYWHSCPVHALEISREERASSIWLINGVSMHDYVETGSFGLYVSTLVRAAIEPGV